MGGDQLKGLMSGYVPSASKNILVVGSRNTKTAGVSVKRASGKTCQDIALHTEQTGPMCTECHHQASRGKLIMEELLKDVHRLLQSIQFSRKGSAGAWRNIYLPQLDVSHVDELSKRVLEKRTEMVMKRESPQGE